MWMTSAPTCSATTGSPLCSQASRSVRCPSPTGPATIVGARREPTVPFLVGELAGHGQVHPGRAERADQPVNVAAERAPVGRHVGRVDEYPKCHGPTRSLRRSCLAEAYATAPVLTSMPG